MLPVMEHFSAAPSVEELTPYCPDLSPEHIRSFVRAFPERFYLRTAPEQLGHYARRLAELCSEQPYILELGELPDGRVTVTFFAYDYPGEFSLLAGMLGASGFNIESGTIATSRPAERQAGGEQHAAGGRSGARGRRRPEKRLTARQFRRVLAAEAHRRTIIDTFVGHVDHERHPDWAERFRGYVARVIPLLTSGTQDAFDEAKRLVNEYVAEALSRIDISSEASMYPVEVRIGESEEGYTRLSVVSTDTPFFLYALSTAFALHALSIEHVEISTYGEQIEDTFDLLDSSGQPIRDEATLQQVRFSAVFTKQFTYFLDRAPDPYTALLRFEELLQELRRPSQAAEGIELLSDAKVLKDLARLLGASDFLWEDFIRLQYENLVPVLTRTRQDRLVSTPPEELDQRLHELMDDADTAESRRRVLNEFKDQETYLIDLDHILHPDLDFFFLSSRLTSLAEVVVNTAVELAALELISRYGIPRTAAGLRAPYSILGLGKLGGQALGYASDIELMFVYSDDGETDGPEPITNREFFERLFSDSVGLIDAKREGIFQVDLRLRPHGSAGPLAVSIASFIRYYSGEASSLEKLALVRLRPIGGDESLGAQIERLRDELLYTSDSIDRAELKRLRALQLKEKGAADRPNVKFSPGGLVDLEYSVQILQVVHGRSNVALRTPGIHQALRGLADSGAIDANEAEQLVQAYRFLRTVINGLRMLRGHAQDLFLPAVDSMEYKHLARRAGYSGKGELTPAEQLHLEFETTTALVRTFVERELGRDAIPQDGVAGLADLVLAESEHAAGRLDVLARLGFRVPKRALSNLRRLGGTREQSYLFAELAVLAADLLPRTPDADMALNNWEQFVDKLPDPEEHYRSLLLQPKRFELLLLIFAGSQFLADTLIANPQFLEWVTTPRIVTGIRKPEALRSELGELRRSSFSHEAWLAALRAFRKREILRIGTRDICLQVDPVEILTELTNLATEIVSAALQAAWDGFEHEDEDRQRFCVLAFGKLGGRELNYSSDIDLLAIFDPRESPASEREKTLYARVMRRLRADLSDHTGNGYLYRVDLRLRPFGSAGQIVHPLPAMVRYYNGSASYWEFQALLKLTPLAGTLELGERFLEAVRPALISAGARTELMRESTLELRRAAVERCSADDVKSGEGGIRDIEFLVQALQLMHARRLPELLTPNTLSALELLEARGVLSTELHEELRSDYLWLRRVEHYLQILEDRQVHTIPRDPAARAALAKRLFDTASDDTTLLEALSAVRTRVRQTFEAILERQD